MANNDLELNIQIKDTSVIKFMDKVERKFKDTEKASNEFGKKANAGFDTAEKSANKLNKTNEDTVNSFKNLQNSFSKGLGILGLGIGVKELISGLNGVVDTYKSFNEQTTKLGVNIGYSKDKIDQLVNALSLSEKTKTTFLKSEIQEALELLKNEYDVKFVAKNFDLVRNAAAALGGSIQGVAKNLAELNNPKNVDNFENILQNLLPNKIGSEGFNKFLAETRKKVDQYNLAKASQTTAQGTIAIEGKDLERLNKRVRSIRDSIVSYLNKSISDVDETLYNQSPKFYEQRQELENTKLEWGEKLLTVQEGAYSILANLYNALKKIDPRGFSDFIPKSLPELIGAPIKIAASIVNKLTGFNPLDPFKQNVNGIGEVKKRDENGNLIIKEKPEYKQKEERGQKSIKDITKGNDFKALPPVLSSDFYATSQSKVIQINYQANAIPVSVKIEEQNGKLEVTEEQIGNIMQNIFINAQNDAQQISLSQ